MFQSVLDSLRYPIWQAPTASIAGPELAAAASRAGGMGSMGLTWAEPEVAAEHVRQVRSQTDSPFFVNFALAFPPHALDAALEAGAPDRRLFLGRFRALSGEGQSRRRTGRYPGHQRRGHPSRRLSGRRLPHLPGE